MRSAAAPVHRPGLDGLRALAVGAVLLYHADVSWLPGGLLGVDVFFVLSGYLICSLLLEERRRHGRADLAAFWRRRARRLLPALFAMLLVVALAGPLLAHDAAPRLRGDVPAALLYVSNWWQISHHQSYFAAMGRPPLLQHLWSLAVEEQFYLVFPLLFVAGLRLTRRTARLGAAALAVGGLSAVAMAVWWHSGGDPSRVYYGTDTHAVGLCVGVALGFVAPLHRQRRTIAPGAVRILDAAGVVGLIVLAALMHGLNDFSGGLYRGGFAAASVATALVVVAVAQPATRVARLLGRVPFAWIGKRSYGIYLWHWPVFMLTRPGLDLPVTGWPLFVMRGGIVVGLAETSWRLVEQPWRTGAAQAAWRRATLAGRRRVAAAAVATTALAVPGLIAIDAPALPRLLAGAPTGATTVLPARDVSPEGLLATRGPGPTTSSSFRPAAPSTAVTARGRIPPTARGRSPASTAPFTHAGAATAPRILSSPGGQILAVGDSVLLAAQDALASTFGRRITVDAAIGRQVDEGIAVLQGYRDAGALSRVSTVVVDLGTNGPMSPAQLDRIAGILSSVPWVVMVNVRVPRSWEGVSNASIDDGVTRYGNMTLADWYDTSAEPGMLWGDGIHPTAAGATGYARLVAGRVAAGPGPPAASTTTPPTTPPPGTSTTGPDTTTTSTSTSTSTVPGTTTATTGP